MSGAVISFSLSLSSVHLPINKREPPTNDDLRAPHSGTDPRSSSGDAPETSRAFVWTPGLPGASRSRCSEAAPGGDATRDDGGERLDRHRCCFGHGALVALPVPPSSGQLLAPPRRRPRRRPSLLDVGALHPVSSLPGPRGRRLEARRPQDPVHGRACPLARAGPAAPLRQRGDRQVRIRRGRRVPGPDHQRAFLSRAALFFTSSMSDFGSFEFFSHSISRKKGKNFKKMKNSVRLSLRLPLQHRGAPPRLLALVRAARRQADGPAGPDDEVRILFSFPSVVLFFLFFAGLSRRRS